MEAVNQLWIVRDVTGTQTDARRTGIEKTSGRDGRARRGIEPDYRICKHTRTSNTTKRARRVPNDSAVVQPLRRSNSSPGRCGEVVDKPAIFVGPEGSPTSTVGTIVRNDTAGNEFIERSVNPAPSPESFGGSVSQS